MNLLRAPQTRHDYSVSRPIFFNILETSLLGYRRIQNEVILSTAKYYTESFPLTYTLNHVLTGKILVKNLAYIKEISVHYVGSDNKWHDTPAKFSGASSHEGYEFWKFKISETVYKTPPEKFFQFAIRYLTNGREYWDNNSNMDYKRKDFFVGFRPKNS